MNKINKHFQELNKRISENQLNDKLQSTASNFILETLNAKYSYNFTWMGRPVIQYPQDVMAMQELIWKVKPNLIIETGIAHGGSLIMYASFLEMMGIENGHVLGIDVDIRKHNRVEIEKHPMYKRITMLEGSSINNEVAKKVAELSVKYKTIMVI